ncbi:hypothetical protein Aab01nite_22130 [Paractinoplanes abujensis]|nr:hypothetical protein Aab01nite_22130 [Actinoplanes abujensis]
MTTISDNLTDYRKQTTAMSSTSANGAMKMRLLQEALSRARMRRPQSDYTPEAHRPARQVALEARHAATRELGGRRF